MKVGKFSATTTKDTKDRGRFCVFGAHGDKGTVLLSPVLQGFSEHLMVTISKTAQNVNAPGDVALSPGDRSPVVSTDPERSRRGAEKSVPLCMGLRIPRCAQNDSGGR